MERATANRASGLVRLCNIRFYIVWCIVDASTPLYSGKQMESGDLAIFSPNRSFLFRKSIIDVRSNHLLLQIESNSFIDSCIRFCSFIITFITIIIHCNHIYCNHIHCNHIPFRVPFCASELSQSSKLNEL